jgi:hypothetical protein
MCHYRIYSVGADGRFTAAKDVDCDDDEAAIAGAVEVFGSVQMEVWQACRRVAILNLSIMQDA